MLLTLLTDHRVNYMEEEKLYKQGIVREVLGCSKSQLDTWLKLRYIDPARPARRAGHPAGYSLENIFQLKMLGLLADRGLALKQASIIIKSVPDMWKHDYVIVGLDNPLEPEVSFEIDNVAHEISIVILPLNIYKSVHDDLEGE